MCVCQDLINQSLDQQADIPLSIVRKTILDYRRKHHPAPSKLRRAELERYMRRVKIKPVGKELQKLKRDHCVKKGEVNEDAVILEHGISSQSSTDDSRDSVTVSLFRGLLNHYRRTVTPQQKSCHTYLLYTG